MLQGLLLAGGDGTRFSEKGCCKPLLTLNGKYLIEYSLENFVALGTDEILIVVGKYRDDIKKAVGNCCRGIPVRYIYQEKPLGILDCLILALEHIRGCPVILQLSDEVYIRPHFDELLKLGRADFLCGYTVPGDAGTIRENYAVICEGDKIYFGRRDPKNKAQNSAAVLRPSRIYHKKNVFRR